MLCANCNAPIDERSSFCSSCGRPVTAPPAGRSTRSSPDAAFIELPPCLRGTIVLRPREGIIGLWIARRQRVVHTHDGDTETSDPGYLAVSNHRVFFIKESGLFSKSYSAIETISYEDLTGVTVKRSFFSTHLIISHDRGETKLFNLAGADAKGEGIGKFEAPETAQQLLNGAAQARLQELERERQERNVQFVLDFSFLKAEMEKGGIVVQTIKCPSCSAGIALPSSGSNTKCPYCGSMVQAQDIFEKMRGLIGSFRAVQNDA